MVDICICKYNVFVVDHQVFFWWVLRSHLSSLKSTDSNVLIAYYIESRNVTENFRKKFLKIRSIIPKLLKFDLESKAALARTWIANWNMEIHHDLRTVTYWGCDSEISLWFRFRYEWTYHRNCVTDFLLPSSRFWQKWTSQMLHTKSSSAIKVLWLFFYFCGGCTVNEFILLI